MDDDNDFKNDHMWPIDKIPGFVFVIIGISITVIFVLGMVRFIEIIRFFIFNLIFFIKGAIHM